MNRSFYAGASGIRAFQSGVDIISHNVANVNTYGYKTTTAEFSDLLYNEMDVNINREIASEEDKLKVGNGVRLSSASLAFDMGVLQTTGYTLDFAIAGDALFALQDKNGDILYTKDGQFHESVEDDGIYLVATDGSYVLDRQGQKITIPYIEDNQIDLSTLTDTLGIYTFENCNGLYRLDDTRFMPTYNSGDAQLAADGSYSIYNSCLERSNTSLAEEMADLIVMQKAYQFSARVVTVADELEQTSNSLRK